MDLWAAPGQARRGMPNEVNAHSHDWEAGSWGVILGVSRCRECGEVARKENFPLLEDDGLWGTPW